MAEKQLSILNLPNVITIARIILVPFIVWALCVQEFLIGFALFSVAGVSDFVDGWLARLQKIQTGFGAYLDPIADKLLMGAIYMTLGLLGHIPLWLVMLVLCRDVFILGVVSIAVFMKFNFQIKPLLTSKINTLLQILLVVLMLADLSFALGLAELHNWAYMAVAASTLISTFAYLVFGLQQYKLSK